MARCVDTPAQIKPLATEIDMNIRLLAAALTVAIGPAASAAPQGNPPPSSPLFPGVGYAVVSTGSGAQFAEILFGSATVYIGAVSQYFFSGGFANDDFTVEYAIDYPTNSLYSIDTSNATTTLIGSTGVTQGIAYGPRWNPQNGTSYVIAPNASCGATTLYTIDLDTGAASEVGESEGSCVPAMAIDPVSGTLYGIDIVSDELVEISASDGSTQPVLAVDVPIDRVDAMDYDPANGLLYFIGEEAGAQDAYLYAFVPDTGFELVGPADGTAFAFAERDGFFNGFESPGFGAH